MNEGNREDVPGTYEIETDGQVLIQLHHSPANLAEALLSNDVISILRGIDAFGTSITAMNVRHDKTWADLVGWDIKLRPSVALEGVWLPGEEFRFNIALAQVQHQQVWANHLSFYQRRDGQARTIKFRPLEQQVADVNGATVEIFDASRTNFRAFEVNAQTRSKFRMVLDEETSIGRFWEGYLRPVVLLMTVVTGTVCGVERLQVKRPEAAPGEERSLITVRMSGVASSPKREISPHLLPRDLLFRLSDMDWRRQAKNIFEVSSGWSYPIEQWATLCDPRFHWPLGRFANAVQAVEAVDRNLNPSSTRTLPSKELINEIDGLLKSEGFKSDKRRAVKNSLTYPEPALADRFKRLASRVSPAMIALVEARSWEHAIARLRHVASHGRPEAVKLTTDLRAPQVATDILLHLLECLFLDQLGFSNDEILELQKRRLVFEQRRHVITNNFHVLSDFGGANFRRG